MTKRIIEVSEEDLNSFNRSGFKYKRRTDLEKREMNGSDFKKEDFFYIKPLNLYVAKKITCFENNLFDCYRFIQENNGRPMTLAEYRFVESYSERNFPEFYKSFANSSNAEWLDAKINIFNNDLIISRSHKLDEMGKLKSKVSYKAHRDYLTGNTKVSPPGWVYFSENKFLDNSKNKTLYSRLLEKTKKDSFASFYAIAYRGEIYFESNPYSKYSFVGMRAVREIMQEKETPRKLF